MQKLRKPHCFSTLLLLSWLIVGCGSSASYVFTSSSTSPQSRPAGPGSSPSPVDNPEVSPSPSPTLFPTPLPTPGNGFSEELPFAEPFLQPLVGAISGLALQSKFQDDPAFDPTKTPSSPQALEPLRVSVDADGQGGLGSCVMIEHPTITPDGQKVLYFSDSKNLAYGSTTRSFLPLWDLNSYLYERNIHQSTTTFVDQRADHTSASNEGLGESFVEAAPAVSRTGRFVAFVSTKSLLPEDQNQDSIFFTEDVYRLDRETGELLLISVGPDGRAVSGTHPSISADGAIVAFQSRAPELVPSGDSEIHVFVRDVSAGTTERLSRGELSFTGRAISADGSKVAYCNYPSAAYPGITSAYVYDRSNNTVTLASPSPTGLTANGSTRYVVLSSDGNTVAFYSFATNLDPTDRNQAGDVFAYDISTKSLERVSRSFDGRDSDAISGGGGVAVSGDGRFVSFVSEATNLVPNDTNGQSDAFLADRESGNIRRITVSSSGAQASGVTDRRFDEIESSFIDDAPSISDDGRYVAFASNADNLVENDKNRGWDLFLYDRVEETVTLQTRRNDGQQAFRDGGSYGPVLSGKGRYVAFHSFADFFADIPERLLNSFFEGIPLYRDLAGKELQMMLVTESGELFGTLDTPLLPTRGLSSVNGQPTTISDDGSTVGFFTCERLSERDVDPNVSAGPTTCNVDSYVFKAQSNTTEIISVNLQGKNATPAYIASLSGDGALASFHTHNDQIDPIAEDGLSSVYLRDRRSGSIQLQSTGLGGAPADKDVSSGKLSGDGRFIVFTTAATNLVASGVVPTEQDIFIREISTGATISLTPTVNGTAPNGESRFGRFDYFGNAVSTTGRFIVFESLASNLVLGDNNDSADIFCFDMAEQRLKRVTPSSGGETNGESSHPNISGDGRYIVFSSAAANLVADDDNGLTDIFVYDQLTNKFALVSRKEAGRPASGPSEHAVISRDGRFIAFSSRADDIVSGDTNMTADIFRVRNPLSL